MRKILQQTTILMAWAVTQQISPALASDEFNAALEFLRRVPAGSSSQSEIQHSWGIVASGNADHITLILAAMDDVGPLAENWLRAAVDTIAERELRDTGRLPEEDLHALVLDVWKSPRARRTAFEWLIQSDPSARDRLLPRMVNDPSLELRYDAIALSIAEAEKAADDNVKRSKFRRAFKSARDLAQTKRCVESLAELGESPDLEKHFGYVSQWMVIGPFDNTDGAGFEQQFPPEREIDFAKQYQGKHETVGWQAYRSDFQELDKVGNIDLNEILGEEKGVTAYVAVKFRSAQDQVVQCRYGTLNATRLWVNGELLISKNIYHMGGEFDQYVAPAALRQGENTILLKVCQNEQTESWARNWDFRFRITDALGGGVWPVADSP